MFERAVAFVLRWEGGFSQVRSDPGNWTGGKVGEGELRGTKFGISAAAYPKLDIVNLTMEAAKAIYRRDYWNLLGLDRVQDPDYALVVFDSAVQHGAGRAAGWMDAYDSVERYLWVRMSFYLGLSGFSTFGLGWMRRMNALMAEVLHPKNSFPDAPILVGRAKRAYLVLPGNVSLPVPCKKVSLVGDKLYIKTYKE